MFNLFLCSSATVRHLLSKCKPVHLYAIVYVYYKRHCCKCSFGWIGANECACSCHGPYKNNVYSGSEPKQLDSPWIVKRAADFSSPWRALIGSNQLWRVNDTPYYLEYTRTSAYTIVKMSYPATWKQITPICFSVWAKQGRGRRKTAI